MVTSLALPQSDQRPSFTKRTLISARANGLRSISTPAKQEETTHVQAESFATSNGSKPFLSPNISDSTLTDEESGSSSGQDEFHLERYSQDTKIARQKSNSARKRVELVAAQEQAAECKKRRRPGLNIITNISGTQAQACTDGVLVEHVQAKRAKTSMNRARSVKSVKPEHVNDLSPGTDARRPIFVTLKDLAELRQRSNRARQATFDGNNAPRRHGDHEDLTGGKLNQAGANLKPALQGQKALPTLPSQQRYHVNPTYQRNDSANDKSIINGIHEPKFEANSHGRSVGRDSTLLVRTPTTPAIVVTPAFEDAPWNEQCNKQRPASSIYSTTTPMESRRMVDQNIPPVPQLPLDLASGHVLQPSHLAEVENDWWDSHESDAGSDDGTLPHLSYPDDSRRFSNESQEHILPLSEDTSRPKSQGWWNLALSPMLSRAGTLKGAKHELDGNDKDIPPVPELPVNRRSRSITHGSAISPETPRRLGLASGRASVWSRWTTWERERGLADPIARDTNEHGEGHARQDSGVTVPFMVALTPSGEGLAAEYYHACAIEQLTGEKFFDCQNHSCAEKLPALRSIFDPRVATDNQPAHVGRSMDAVATPATNPDTSHTRSFSDSTNARSEPEELSPNVRQANTAAVMKARALDSTKMSEGGEPAKRDDEGSQLVSSVPNSMPISTTRTPGIQMPTLSPPKGENIFPNIAAIVPPHPSTGPARQSVASPGPVSPEMQRTMISQGALAMGEMGRDPGEAVPWPVVLHSQVNYPEPTDRKPKPPPITVYTSFHQKPVAQETAVAPEEGAKGVGDDKPRRKSLMERLNCVRRKPRAEASTSRSPKRRRCAVLIGIALLLMIIACIVLAMQLTRKGDKTPTQSQWLNLTGYPPIPTGISTIARPDAVAEQSQCVQPTTLWSCALPKESQAEIAPNNADQPNFRFEIKFRNGTVPSNMTIPITSSAAVSKRSQSRPGIVARANDPFTNDLFNPNPAPPSRADQLFLGNTTDNITTPFDGEETPFFMTFIPTSPVDPSAAANSSTTGTARLLLARQSTNLSSVIPAPSVLPDGSAAPANLLPVSPFPTSQPVRLYNRGRVDEHYGFYMYYDKSIFLSSSAPLNSTGQPANGVLPADESGGSLRSQAVARCTFSQTRFRVQMYTSPSFAGALLGSLNRTANSATNFARPGSFPYPATITLDRHGGNINKKAVYCYGVDAVQVIQSNVKSIVGEIRGFGGTLVNAAPGLIQLPGGGNGGFDQNAGGIDGGTGGCGCSWQNWR